jgi:hypothetical protein
MLNSFEQSIYNEYLKVSRQVKDKPYRLRKNFNSIEPNIIVFIKRIARILTKFPNINTTDFFKAPYVLYGKDDFFDLQYYTSQRAIKAYALYISKESDHDPDSDDILNKIVSSLKFLKTFLIENNLTLNSYADHISGQTKSFLVHWKERKLHTYVLIEMPNILNYIRHEDQELLKFMFGENIHENIQIYKNRFFSSKKCKLLVKEGLKKITNETH